MIAARNAMPFVAGRSVAGDEPEVLTDIYHDDCNIVVWQRQLAPELQQEVSVLLQSNDSLQTSLSLSPQSAHGSILRSIGGSAKLADDIAELVDMFCQLFETDVAGLRLTALEEPMCPRFHVDRVPCRLVTTYLGPATEWLPHHRVDRSRLGRGNDGRPDEHSGLYPDRRDVNQASSGEVLLLKGEGWEGNEGAGLVHRSPHIPAGGKRLLLTLDLI